MEETVGQKLRRNTRSSVTMWAFQRGLKFIQVPIIIGFLGEAGYGLIGFAFSALAYFTIYNFGINQAYVKYTADCHVTKDYRRLSSLLSTGMLMGMFFSLVIILITFAFTDAFIEFFNIETSLVGDARFTARTIAVVCAFTTVFGVFRAALIGIQRIDVGNNCRMVFSILDFIAVIILLNLGFGVRAVILIYALNIMGSTGLMGWSLMKYLPELRLNPLRAQWSSVKSLLSLGSVMQLLGITSIVVTTLDSMVITKYKGLAFMGAYLVGRHIVDRIKGLPTQGFGPLAPASADLHARGDRKKLSAVFTSAMRFTAVVSVYFTAFIGVNSDLVMFGYAGAHENTDIGILALRFLCVSSFIHTLTGPGTSMLRGAGKPMLEMLYQVISIAIFFVVFRIGEVRGNDALVVMAFPTGMAVGSLLFLVLSNRYFRAPALCPFRSVWMILAAGVGFSFAARFGLDLFFDTASATRWQAVMCVVGMGVVYSAAFGLAVWLLPGLTQGDKDQIIRLIPMGRRIRGYVTKRLGMQTP